MTVYGKEITKDGFRAGEREKYTDFTNETKYRRKENNTVIYFIRRSPVFL